MQDEHEIVSDFNAQMSRLIFKYLAENYTLLIIKGTHFLPNILQFKDFEFDVDTYTILRKFLENGKNEQYIKPWFTYRL